MSVAFIAWHIREVLGYLAWYTLGLAALLVFGYGLVRCYLFLVVGPRRAIYTRILTDEEMTERENNPEEYYRAMIYGAPRAASKHR